jgi:heme-degrading monooxygenase HmoA
MIVVRNVFRCKPGMAKELAKKFTATVPLMKKNTGVGAMRVLTDLSSTFWTVVVETEAESLEAWDKQFSAYSSEPEVRKAMDGYMDLVEGGHREIFRIE